MYKDKEKQKEATKERVRRYRDKAKGVTSEGVTPEGVTGKVIQFDNGSYIHIHKLIDPKWRSLLTYLSEHMRYPDGLRVGIQGPTIAEVKPCYHSLFNKPLHRPQTLTS